MEILIFLISFSIMCLAGMIIIHYSTPKKYRKNDTDGQNNMGTDRVNIRRIDRVPRIKDFQIQSDQLN